MYMGKKTEAYTAAREIIDAVDKNGKKVWNWREQVILIVVILLYLQNVFWL